MSWMSQLYYTYEQNIGKNQQDTTVLTPLAHMNANAQIEVRLDAAGNFQGANVVEKQDATTLIPVTEASAGRSSGIAPHALSDTLSYIAGDYGNYCKNEKERSTANKKYNAYMEQLEKWMNSPYVHPMAEAVYHYLNKKELILDLIKAGIISLDEGVFDGKKISGQPYEKAMVRFCILGLNGYQNLWEDTSLIHSYVDYTLSTQTGKKDICYLSGKEQVRTENHPKGIVAANYGAKLISANDKQGFTYKGRFQDSDQAYSLSYESSQKIHAALTWLAKKQSASVGTTDKRTFVCWNPEGKKVPDILDPLSLLEEQEEDMNSTYRKKLIKTFQGYQDQFQENECVVIMGLDAATTGRLSITYYSELLASDFFERILFWGKTCNWKFLRFDEQKKPYYKTETPLFRDIAKCAFGREQGKFIELNDKVLKEQTQRLLKCMLDKQTIPRDIVHALVMRASTPLAYSWVNREKVISTACAVISKYYLDRGFLSKEGNDEMKLDLKNNDRSYLFGRLLAVLEKVERATYDRGENREPNAIRLQSAYVNHPMQTWKILEDSLKPYFQKLRPGSREFYRKLISEIIIMFSEEDEKIMNQGLKESYLLGYYLQREELNKKGENSKEDVENE